MNGELNMVKMISGYKMTEVGVIPEDWEVKTLGKLACINGRIGFRGYTVKDLVRKGEGAIAIGGKHISKNFLDISDAEYISWKKYYESPEIMVRKGDIVLAQRGTLGKSALIKSDIGPATINPSLVLINKIKCNNLYLIYNIQSSSVTDYIQQINAQTSIPMISQKQIEGIKIAIAKSDSEQTAIATALSDVDSLISALTKKIEKKKAIKQGLMQQLLTGKKRLSGFNDKWKSILLGDIAEVKDGTHQTPQYVKSGGKPFYSVENVTADDFKNVKHISLEEHKALTSNYRIEKGDVLMTRIGSIGCCKYVDWDVDASFYVSLALLKINEKYDSKFISYLSNIKSFKEEVMLNSLVFAIPQKINLGNISLIKVYIPTSKAEQTAIANILSDCDSEIAALEEKRDKYKEIKQGMMQQLLTGKIRLI